MAEDRREPPAEEPAPEHPDEQAIADLEPDEEQSEKIKGGILVSFKNTTYGETTGG
jgi:hypothetical protein